MLNNTIKGNDSGSTANPDDLTITRVLDMVTSAAQGDILYRDASVWNRLAAGTSGQILASQGASANPHWITAIGTGNVVGPSSALDGCIPTWDGTTGQLLKDSTLKLSTLTGITRGADTTTVRNRFILGVADCAEFSQLSTAGHAFGSTLTVRRVADYTGTATPGWFNSGINVLTTVASGTNTGSANEVGITGAIRFDGGGYNCGIFGQAWRTSGTGWGWALIGDMQDQTGAESVYPIHGLEIDCMANGINTTYKNRFGIMVVSGIPTGGSTAISQCWNGIALTAENADNTLGYYKHGLHVGHEESLGAGYTRLTCDVGVKVLANGTYGFWDLGTKTNGILLAGIYSAAALDIGSNNIAMTGSLGSTSSRLTKGWFTDLQVTNAIAASITGSAPTLTTARAIYGNNFDGSAALTQIIASTYGGTGNGFTKFSGPASSEKIFTLPNASDSIGCLGTIETWTAAQTFNSGKLILAGATSGTTTLNSGAVAGSSVLTLPVATDTLVGKATIDTLTNKTLTAPVISSISNTGTTTLNTATGTAPLTLSVQNGGDANNSSSGSGADYNHNLTYSVPANFMTSGRALRITAQFTFATGSAAPNYTLKLKMGSTTVGSHNVTTPVNSLSGIAITKTWIMQAVAAPGASVNVHTGDPGAAGVMGPSAVNFNNVAQPVALATNGSLTLQVASQWSAAGTGTNTITLSQLIVEVLN